jgi:hypothetical protein
VLLLQVLVDDVEQALRLVAASRSTIPRRIGCASALNGSLTIA